MRDYLYLLILTGVRKTNLMEMEWNEISFPFKQLDNSRN
ncbi:hypothetical protein CAXC1_110020 [Candidatus Xenohaliotis californiensis]|uniref:Tyr recombinase domain-containing protein n=1 Tax=Candidatus Xenohaliotis californiensis TaxID=84677 RepID=A0ABM9N6W0_9RICK|nr:hypothetical protein CAXC1_110020 [Candidatus Xenohaliotis californiensis]